MFLDMCGEVGEGALASRLRFFFVHILINFVLVFSSILFVFVFAFGFSCLILFYFYFSFSFVFIFIFGFFLIFDFIFVSRRVHFHFRFLIRFYFVFVFFFIVVPRQAPGGKMGELSIAASLLGPYAFSSSFSLSLSFSFLVHFYFSCAVPRQAQGGGRELDYLPFLSIFVFVIISRLGELLILRFRFCFIFPFALAVGLPRIFHFLPVSFSFSYSFSSAFRGCFLWLRYIVSFYFYRRFSRFFFLAIVDILFNPPPCDARAGCHQVCPAGWKPGDKSMKPGLDASMEYFSSGATESEEDPLQVRKDDGGRVMRSCIAVVLRRKAVGMGGGVLSLCMTVVV